MNFYLNLLNACLRLTYWFYYAPMLSFATPVLLERGYSNTQIGFIIAAGGVLAVLIQSVLANYVDHHPQMSTIKLSFLLALSAAPIFSLTFFLMKESFLLSAVYTILYSIGNAFSPFLNNFTNTLSKTGYQLNFALTFSIGSVGYSIASTIVGKLNDVYGTKAILISAVIGLATYLITLFIAERVYQNVLKQKLSELPEEEKKQEEEEEAQSISYFQFVKNNKLFLVAIIGVMLIMFSDSVFYNFTLQIVDFAGGTSAHMGILLSVCSMCQIPGFLAFPFFKKKFSLSKLLCISAVFYGVKSFIVFSAGSIPVLYLSGLTRLINYPFFTSAIIPFTNMVMKKGEANRGQTLYTIASSLSSLAASSLGGLMLDYIGVKKLLLVAFIVATVGILIFIPSISKVEEEYEKRA